MLAPATAGSKGQHRRPIQILRSLPSPLSSQTRRHTYKQTHKHDTDTHAEQLLARHLNTVKWPKPHSPLAHTHTDIHASRQAQTNGKNNPRVFYPPPGPTVTPTPPPRTDGLLEQSKPHGPQSRASSRNQRSPEQARNTRRTRAEHPGV